MGQFSNLSAFSSSASILSNSSTCDELNDDVNDDVNNDDDDDNCLEQEVSQVHACWGQTARLLQSR